MSRRISAIILSIAVLFGSVSVVSQAPETQPKASAVVLATTTTAPPTTTTTTEAPTTTTEAPPPPPPTTTTTEAPEGHTEATQVVPASTGSGDPNDPASWDRLAACESGSNWQINTGNGYYGGLQFSLSSWQAVGGSGYPHEHSRETQIAMGQRLHASGGWNHWPGCSRSFGWI